MEVEPLTSLCGRMVCAAHTLLTRSFSQCIMRESIIDRRDERLATSSAAVDSVATRR